MQTPFTPQMLMLAGLAVVLVVALLARYFQQHGHPREHHPRFGPDHNQAITDMGNRTRAEAERTAREQASVR